MKSKIEAHFEQEHNDGHRFGSDAAARDFAERVRFNQRKLRACH